MNGDCNRPGKKGEIFTLARAANHDEQQENGLRLSTFWSRQVALWHRRTHPETRDHQLGNNQSNSCPVMTGRNRRKATTLSHGEIATGCRPICISVIHFSTRVCTSPSTGLFLKKPNSRIKGGSPVESRRIKSFRYWSIFKKMIHLWIRCFMLKCPCTK